MKKLIKRIILIVLCVAIVGGAAWGGLRLLRKSRTGPVNVYSVGDFAMTDYYGDTAEAYGPVTATGLQNVYISETQQVTEIFVSEGQTVQVGDPILAFDTTLTDIELEKAQLNYEKLQLSLQNALDEQAYINTLRPYAMVLITPPVKEIVLETQPTPMYLEGKGTENDPMYILWNGGTGMTMSYLESLFPKASEPDPEPEGGGEPAPEPSPEPSPEPAPATEPAPEPTPAPEGGGEGGSEGGEPMPEPDPDPVDPDRIWLVFVIRNGNALNGQVLDYYGIRLDRSSGVTKFYVIDAILPEYMFEYDKQEEPYYKSYGSSYTRKEIDTMKADIEQKIKDLELQIQMAEVELERLQHEMDSGMVFSKVDGVVKALRDVDEAKMSGQPLVELSAGGGYYVKINIGELSLDSITVGQTVDVMSWESYTSYTGTIVEISNYPSAGYNSWTNGNNNISWYPATVFIDESAQLREYEYVSVTYSTTPGESGLYLENTFIRTEGGISYVMVRGEDGLLERRTVQTGKSIWGSYTMIRGGLTVDDRIAFPYGSAVFEGAETVEAEASEFYNSY